MNQEQKVRLGLNGLGGRIANAVLRAWVNEWGGPDGPIQIVGLNSSGRRSLKELRAQLRRDLVHGDFPVKLEYEDNANKTPTYFGLEGYEEIPSKSIGNLIVTDEKVRRGHNAHQPATGKGYKIPVFAEHDALSLPWQAVGADIVIDCTGKYLTTEAGRDHLTAGAKKVLLSAPAKDDITKTVLYVINEQELTAEDNIISMASCTTGAAAPVVDALAKVFGMPDAVFLNTTHAQTVSQKGFADDIEIHSTGAAKSLGKIFPELAGKSDGIATRVDTKCGSLCHLEIELPVTVTEDEINYALYFATQSYLDGVLDYIDYDDGDVSVSDIVGTPQASIFVPSRTKVIAQSEDRSTAHVFAWYDNEYGYACSLLRLVVSWSHKNLQAVTDSCRIGTP